MTAQEPTPAEDEKKTPYVFYGLSVLLIGWFLYRMLITATEYPSRTAMILDMTIDAACLGALIGVRKSGPMPLFVIAVMCGVGLFLIRLHSDASWWTGHWNYSIR